MEKLSVRKVLQRMDEQVPNDCPREEKLRWVNQAEDMVRREILGIETSREPLEMDGELSAPCLYEDLYQRYAEAQIFYQRGEIDRYNAAAAAWNGIFLGYKDYVNRMGLGNTKSISLKLC